MSLFSWLFPAGNSKSPPSAGGALRPQSHRPAARGAAEEPAAQPAGRKGERMARRELLYSVVRQTMTRAGVLSSGYKFKVLSLDAKGRHFLVMIDLARPYGDEPSRLTDIESMIAQAAKVRHEIVVNAVYWRVNGQASVADPKAPGGRTRPAEEISQPAVLESHPGALEPAAASPGSRFEPIQPDEVAAFKSALAAGVSGAAAVAAAAPPARTGATARAGDGAMMHGPQSYTLLTGFEDTELPDARAPVLSGTQYGDLN